MQHHTETQEAADSVLEISIEPGQFYGRTSSSNSNTVFQIFARQELAFQHFDSLSDASDVKVFTLESVVEGKRKFLVADVHTFVERYIAVNFERRHLYEIIRENYPCRLYFDLEFSLEENPTLDGEALTKKWVHFVLWKCYEYFDISLSFSNVIDLESSTDKKFSRHITFILREEDCSDEILFLNNIEVGAFVFDIINDILEETVESQQLSSSSSSSNQYITTTRPKKGFEDFWVLKDGKRDTCFVDLGVYTKNRAFRLFSSCKYGKKTALKITKQSMVYGSNSLIPQPRSSSSSSGKSKKVSEARAIRMLDLLRITFVVPVGVTPVDADTIAKDLKSYRILKRNEQGSMILCRNSRGKFLVAPRRHTRSTPPISSLALSTRAPDIAKSHIKRPRLASYRDSSIASSTSMPSPFSALDEFVTSTFCSIGGVQGQLSGWYLYVANQSGSTVHVRNIYKLRYSVAHNRFCQNIGRSHRSNGIMFEVDLFCGVIYQTCWDPDCRGYRSPIVQAPATVIPSYNIVEEMCFDMKLARAIDMDPTAWPLIS